MFGRILLWLISDVTTVIHLVLATYKLKRRLNRVRDKIFVGNLPFAATEDELFLLFDSHTKVFSAKLVVDRKTGESRGFGFVEVEEGNKVIAELDGSEYEGREIIVKTAISRGGWQ